MTAPLIEYSLLAFSSLFVIVDPVSTVPIFLAMTQNDSPSQRVRTAGQACMVMTAVLLGFSLFGHSIFHFLGITLPAFQIAGSIVLLLVSLDMLQARRSRVQHTNAETMAGAEKEDIAPPPLGVPLLAGPGAISTVILLRNQARDAMQLGSLLSCIVLVACVSFLILRLSSHGAKWLNPIAMRVATRLMGLLLAAIACQFMVTALRDLQVVAP